MFERAHTIPSAVLRGGFLELHMVVHGLFGCAVEWHSGATYGPIQSLQPRCRGIGRMAPREHVHEMSRVQAIPLIQCVSLMLRYKILVLCLLCLMLSDRYSTYANGWQ